MDRILQQMCLIPLDSRSFSQQCTATKRITTFPTKQTADTKIAMALQSGVPYQNDSNAHTCWFFAAPPLQKNPTGHMVPFDMVDPSQKYPGLALHWKRHTKQSQHPFEGVSSNNRIQTLLAYPAWLSTCCTEMHAHEMSLQEIAAATEKEKDRINTSSCCSINSNPTQANL